MMPLVTMPRVMMPVTVVLVRIAKNEDERARLLVVGSSDFDLLVRMTKNGDGRDRLLVVVGSSDFDLLVRMTKNGGERDRLLVVGCSNFDL